jgi:hypothetical protein
MNFALHLVVEFNQQNLLKIIMMNLLTKSIIVITNSSVLSILALLFLLHLNFPLVNLINHQLSLIHQMSAEILLRIDV